MDIDRFEKIAKKVSIPSVLHGGSGTSKNSLKKCIKLGIIKINIWTDLMVAATEGIKESLKTADNFGDINLVAEAAIKECLIKYYKMFNCLSRI
ncbi:class II fructose-bisphosphate aldolase [Tepidimicrobium xylanilyticum]|uniref:Fructose-bisphosphate aldolase class-II n=1 Tax=Tepidimicrobium xylanilyticum TaxID=1123352 RepID=A0A1H2RGT3_9FIRM|nr:class II fructose-bisphosphate aldolase [Tepidimicrobium xylanilyticum]SDW18370.1 Fructose-bisphosphate aldolase class-II [Tepidimicrobium xylanilyticum]